MSELPQAEVPQRDYVPINPEPGWKSVARRLGAAAILIGGLSLKFGFAAAKFLSIFIAVGGYALIWGWSFAVGFVLLILVHELGHYVEGRRRGANPSLPVFIPFLGAYVAFKDARLTPWQHSWIALAGPIAGSIGAVATWVAGEALDSDLLRALAYTGFLLNLFNLIPIGFLDGGVVWRMMGVMRLGGTPRKAMIVGTVYVALAGALVLAMFATHVAQDRL